MNIFSAIKRLKKNKHKNKKKHITNIIFTGSLENTMVTSDAYDEPCMVETGDSKRKGMSWDQKPSPRSMNFLPLETEEESRMPLGCGESIWEFIQFDTKSSQLCSPRTPPRIKRQFFDFSKSSTWNKFKEEERDAPSPEPVKEKKTLLKKIQCTPRRTIPLFKKNIATPNSAATDPLSDDEDSIWEDMPNKVSKDLLEVKYSQRSDISDGSDLLEEQNISSHLLHPNDVHFPTSYWTERNNRIYVEDRILIDRVQSFSSSHFAAVDDFCEPTSIYAVFDGHAGYQCSQFCVDWLSAYFVRKYSISHDIPSALFATFKQLDRDFMESNKKDGTTACVAVLTGHEKLTVANVGDSRALLVRADGTFKPLSVDHKANTPCEVERIRSLGGVVAFNKGWRVEGKLSVSRAIGDLPLKPFVSSDPDILETLIDKEDSFLVLASDGIFDVLSNSQVTTTVLSYCGEPANGEYGLKYASKLLCDRAKELRSNDNLSVIIVDLRNG